MTKLKTSKKGNTQYFRGGMWLGSDGSVCIAHYGKPRFIAHIRKRSTMFAPLVRFLKKTATPQRIAKFEAAIPRRPR
jgi:hypothetical protein